MSWAASSNPQPKEQRMGMESAVLIVLAQSVGLASLHLVSPPA